VGVITQTHITACVSECEHSFVLSEYLFSLVSRASALMALSG